MKFEMSYYEDFLSADIARHVLKDARPIAGIEGLEEIGERGGLETPDALRFLVELYETVKPELARVLAQRRADRKFIDERVKACSVFNRELGRHIDDPDYHTILGLQDSNGRVVFGPLSHSFCKPGGKPVASLPEYLKGPHVTLFGPPDSAKMAVNAMNAYHRKLPGEPEIVSKLLSEQTGAPFWGADDEDSKTPMRADLIDAGVNLTACFKKSIAVTEGAKKYELAFDRLSLPIKRFPGLALPSAFLFYRKNPIPLHLYDFALHFYENSARPEALVFYVPKLENEEEARYVHLMVATAEHLILKSNPAYRAGTVRLMIVLENPRAIVRTHEIVDALHPYFAGASLGWHDYLASTARIFKNDSAYRIPVKADPNIVIKYIQASHRLVANVVGSRGGIKVGGMYGILPVTTDLKSPSFQVTLRGYFKDVITQFKRGLNGFWVAHPDFVRLGLALVEAWRQKTSGDSEPLKRLVAALLNESYQKEVLAFIDAPDVEALDENDPGYVRSLIVADIKESDTIANNDPDEVRYNVFQSLQYLTDWLAGNGCVALPTVIDGVPVRVMDDLATAERSRWEVWHEIHHGRFSVEEFIRIAHEEMNFIRRDLSNEKKIVQVKFDERTKKWYPVAFKLMLKLMTDREPAEFATELLLPFTIDSIRSANSPWEKAAEIDAKKYRLEEWVERYDHYFEICGVDRFASQMAGNTVEDLAHAETLIRSFDVSEILSAASFHGDIGQSSRSLDVRASKEQAAVQADGDQLRTELLRLGEEYRKRFGFKFLISAHGKSGAEMLKALNARLQNSKETELSNARGALVEISLKRMGASPRNALKAALEEWRAKYQVAGASVAVSAFGQTQTVALGERVRGEAAVEADTLFEIASLSKSVASAFAIEFFRERNVPLDTPVNALLAQSKSAYRLRSKGDPAWADRVTLAHLMSHAALNMHYVSGVSGDQPPPRAADRLSEVFVVNEPGTRFQYSGGGFIVLEHVIESIAQKPVQELTRGFLSKLAIEALTFQQDSKAPCAHGYFDSGEKVKGSRLHFPAFAAGALSTSGDVARFLAALSDAYVNLNGAGPISHDTAVEMFYGTDKGCKEFMGCLMGLGIFTAEAGPNRLAIHQGANEGFRAIFVHCYAGPDRGKGVVILCNGDNRAVLFIAEAVRALFEELKIEGVDFAQAKADVSAFASAGIPQEQIVNLGYKALIFSAFEPDLPEAITRKGPIDSLAQYNALVGAKIVSITNQKFARAENLISANRPAFDPELFGRQGKIMDSWETARHNAFECDTLVLELKKPVRPRYLSLSTEFHDGNHAEKVRVSARSARDGEWTELVTAPMKGHSHLDVDLNDVDLCEDGADAFLALQVKVEIHPDGGFSRLGLYETLPPEAATRFKPVGAAQCVRFEGAIPKSKKPLVIHYDPHPDEIRENRVRVGHSCDIDWASQAFGGRLVRATNEHYGPAVQVISPYPPIHMFDGLESARSRETGHFEEVVLELGQPIRVGRVVFDFTYFVNNNPRSVSIEGLSDCRWLALVAETNVKAFAGNLKEFRVDSTAKVEQLRIRTIPDGGVNRIRVYAATSR